MTLAAFTLNGLLCVLLFAALAVGWSLVRFVSTAAPQLRDILFGVVTQAAWRRASVRTVRPAWQSGRV